MDALLFSGLRSVHEIPDYDLAKKLELLAFSRINWLSNCLLPHISVVKLVNRSSLTTETVYVF